MTSGGVDARDLGYDVPLTTPGGAPVVLRVQSVSLQAAGNASPAVSIEALADQVAWARIDAGALLHLDPDARGPNLGDAFGGDEPVRIVAVLDGLVARELGELDGAVIDARLREGDPDDPLLDARSWWALDVTGRIDTPAGMDAELRAGLRTIWPADPPPVGMATVIAAALEDAGIDPRVEETDDARWIVRFIDDDTIGLAVPRERASQAIVYLVLPRLCPPERRAELARLAALVNFDLPIGCLEIDVAIGQARVRTSADVSGDSLSLAVARNLVGAARHLARRWFPAVERVFDGLTAEDAHAAS